MFDIQGRYTSAKVTIDNVEETCVKQIVTFVNHPAFTNKVVIMPDTHAGKGSVIGFTMPMTSKMIPNVVGVDIGCGMISCDIGEKLPMSFDELDKKIRERIPFGVNAHDNAIMHLKNEFPWQKNHEVAKYFINAYNVIYGTKYSAQIYDVEWFNKKCVQIGANTRRAINSIGTLGGGNHFVEIGQSNINNHFWLTIHTGSRNFGKCVCDYWQHKATKEIRRRKNEDLKNKIDEIRKTYTGNDIKKQIDNARIDLGLDALVSDQLNYLEGSNAVGYLFDMIFAQQYAEVNRQCIIKLIAEIIGLPILKSIESVHNFIDFRDFIIRKGAIRSYIGEEMIIPFNMRDGILICEGKSNADWNYSAPHGSGRVLSRSAAKKQVNLEEFKKSMEGIFSTSVGRGTLDESPMAYKDTAMIEEAIKPTANIIMKIKPIMNLKDSEGKSD